MSQRGYFALGVEGITKPRNAGALFRTAHAFGAHFVFAIAPNIPLRQVQGTDTSKTAEHVPLYEYETPGELDLPRGCRLVGIEFLDDAVTLPSFRHPDRAAYVLGSERGSLTPALLERCDYTIKVPTSFCINVSVAGAIVLYDRMISRGRFAERPVKPGGPTEALADHVHGGPVLRTLKG